MKKTWKKSLIGSLIAIISGAIANLITFKAIQPLNIIISLVLGAILGIIFLQKKLVF